MASTLFQTLTYSSRDIAFLPSSHDLAPAPSAPGRPLTAHKLARNTASGSTPVVLHFNGHEKALMNGPMPGNGPDRDSWWSRMWFVSGGSGTADEQAHVKRWVRERVRRGGAMVGATGEFLSWEALGCERADVWADAA